MKKTLLSLAIISLALTSCEKSSDNYLDNIVEMTINFNKSDIKKDAINRPTDFPDYLNSLTVATYKEPANPEGIPEDESSYRKFNFNIVDDGSGSDDATVIAYVGNNTITAATNKSSSVCEISAIPESETANLVSTNKTRVAQIYYYGKSKNVLFEEGVDGTTTINMEPGSNRNITVLKLESDNILSTYNVFVEVTHGEDVLSAQFTPTNNRIVTYEVNENANEGDAITYNVKYVEIADNGNVTNKNISESADLGNDTEWDIEIISPVNDPLVTSTYSLKFDFLDLYDGGLISITR